MKLADLEMPDPPEPLDADPPLDAVPSGAKRKGWRTHKFQPRSARVEAEKVAARPDWMANKALLPMKPPGRTR